MLEIILILALGLLASALESKAKEGESYEIRSTYNCTPDKYNTCNDRGYKDHITATKIEDKSDG